MTLVSPFEELYREAPVGLLVMTAEGVVAETNDTLLAWLGRARETFVGTPFVDALDHGSRLAYDTRHAAVLRLQGEVREVPLVLVRADGSPLQVLLTSRVRGDGVVHSALFEASGRADYERELLGARRVAEASEVRVRVLQASSSAFVSATTETEICEALVVAADEAFAATAVGVFLLDDQGEYVLTAGTSPVLGMVPRNAPKASDEALLSDTIITVHARDVDGLYGHVSKALREVRLESVTVVPLLRTGVPIGVLACFFARGREFDEAFGDLHAALSRQAAQAILRVRMQKELERNALYDQLTGLANRKLLLETTTTAVSRAALAQHSLAIVFLDLDGFKGINDDLGHAVGDSVLQQVSARIRGCVRQHDEVGRYGGDEFVAVCEGADAEAATSIADRICRDVGQPLEGVPPEYRVTASVGVVIYSPVDGEPPTNDELLSLADGAMYLSKSAGKNRVSILYR